ncbi:MAG: molybdenum cofactor biosynthesis protein MoaE [Rhodovibrionaceae bacterium]|nr:molybdenum cofactor biosynthesis protein MoaE [Rhodovibrionaceae bacterium]
MIRVQRSDFDPGAEISALTQGRHDVGALTVFVGLVRDMAGEQRISSMELEHYPGMTEKMLERIEAEARERWALNDTLIVHRYGPLAPGERIVLVACTSTHRAASFEACEFLIDWLKTKAPFWKKEHGPDGDAHWVEARGSDDAAAARWNRKPGDAAE